MTLSEALDRYKETVSVLKKGFQQEKYRIDAIKRHPLCGCVISEIRSHNIAEYRDHRLQTTNLKTGRLLSPSTVRQELSLLSHMYDIAIAEWGVATDNPVKPVRRPPSAPGRDRRLTRREEKLILRYCEGYSNPELKVIIVLAVETAMRQGEILSLTWEHVHLGRRIVHLPDTKNGSKRDVPLSITAVEALKSLGVEREGNVFTYTARGLKSVWRQMTSKLDIADLHFHDLRHEAASRLFELGTLDMMEVAAITGHKSLGMLKRYTHLKAQKLVPKLDRRKSRSMVALLGKFMPYPGIIRKRAGDYFEIELPDFGIAISSHDRQGIEERAGAVLSITILQRLRNGEGLPEPDSYTQSADHHGEHTMVMPHTEGDLLAQWLSCDQNIGKVACRCAVRTSDGEA
jgi:integrase